MNGANIIDLAKRIELNQYEYMGIPDYSDMGSEFLIRPIAATARIAQEVLYPIGMLKHKRLTWAGFKWCYDTLSLIHSVGGAIDNQIPYVSTLEVFVNKITNLPEIMVKMLQIGHDEESRPIITEIGGIALCLGTPSEMDGRECAPLTGPYVPDPDMQESMLMVKTFALAHAISMRLRCNAIYSTFKGKTGEAAMFYYDCGLLMMCVKEYE